MRKRPKLGGMHALSRLQSECKYMLQIYRHWRVKFCLSTYYHLINVGLLFLFHFVAFRNSTQNPFQDSAAQIASMSQLIFIKTTCHFLFRHKLHLTVVTRSPESARLTKEQRCLLPHSLCLLLKHLRFSELSSFFSLAAPHALTWRFPPSTSTSILLMNLERLLRTRSELHPSLVVGGGQEGAGGELPTSHFGVSRGWRQTTRGCSGGSAACGLTDHWRRAAFRVESLKQHTSPLPAGSQGTGRTHTGLIG